MDRLTDRARNDLKSVEGPQNHKSISTVMPGAVARSDAPEITLKVSNGHKTPTQPQYGNISLKCFRKVIRSYTICCDGKWGWSFICGEAVSSRRGQ